MIKLSIRHHDYLEKDASHVEVRLSQRLQIEDGALITQAHIPKIMDKLKDIRIRQGEGWAIKLLLEPDNRPAGWAIVRWNPFETNPYLTTIYAPDSNLRALRIHPRPITLQPTTITTRRSSEPKIENVILDKYELSTPGQDNPITIHMTMYHQGKAIEVGKLTDVPADEAKLIVSMLDNKRLVADVSFEGWTIDRKMRSPKWIGLRDDKKPKDCVLVV